jgi:hypothetical protein
MRPPAESTTNEIELYNFACGRALDDEGLERNVVRLDGELDEPYRARINDAERIKRKADRADRGMSLLPSAAADALEIPVHLTSMMPDSQTRLESFGHAHQVTALTRQCAIYRRLSDDLMQALIWVNSLSEFGQRGTYEQEALHTLIPLIQRATATLHGDETE